jgi:hypothetical protein
VTRHRPAHARRQRSLPKLVRFALVLFGAAIGFGVVGAGVAFGYWLTTDSSNPAQAGADTLPAGTTPAAPSTSPNLNSNSVVITFAQSATTPGHTPIPASNYSLRRYPAGGGAAVAVTASCSGVGTITCTESSVPDGQWQYTDTPTYGTNWVGTESPKSPMVTVDTHPPSVSLTFPAASGLYDATTWTALSPISGTATDATSGVPGASSINVTLTQVATGLTWNGSGFTSGSNTVHPTTFAAGAWTYAFPSGDFPADGQYSVGVSATDAAGNTSGVTFASFTYDNTPPTGSIGYTNGYTTTTPLVVTFSAADATSGVNPASGQLERASATLSGGSCGSFGPFNAVGPLGVTSPYTDSAVASGNCYQYEYLVPDNAGNQATITSTNQAWVDTTPPSVPTLSYIGLGNTFVSGSTVYYRSGATSGGFSVTAASTDPESGIASYAFPSLGSGWTVSGSGATRTYTWSSATPSTSAGPFTVTAKDGAGLVSSGSNATNPFNLTADNAAPTGGAIVANGSPLPSYNTSGNVSLSVTSFTDTGSGMATNTITRASGTLTNNTCGTLSGSTPVTVIGGNDSATLPTGCYQYTLTGTDNVGNTATATSAVVMVDTTPPTLTITTTGSGIYYSGSGTTVYFSGTGSPSFTITASDPSTGINTTVFPAAPAGWTKSTGTNSATYKRGTANANSSLSGVTATNNAGSTTTENVTIAVDNTAPVNNLTLTNQSGGSAYLSGTTLYYQGPVAGSFTISNALTDAGSGPASTTFGGLTGTSAGFTFAGGTVSTPAGGPYVSATISWTANTLSSPSITITGTDNVGNAVSITLKLVDDTNTLTQSAPSFNGNSGHTTFQGTSSATTTITVYWCLGAVSSCTASNSISNITTAGAAAWSTPSVSLAHSQSYTSQAYQTDPDGTQLVSNIEQFTT